MIKKKYIILVSVILFFSCCLLLYYVLSTNNSKVITNENITIPNKLDILLNTDRGIAIKGIIDNKYSEFLESLSGSTIGYNESILDSYISNSGLTNIISFFDGKIEIYPYFLQCKEIGSYILSCPAGGIDFINSEFSDNDVFSIQGDSLNMSIIKGGISYDIFSTQKATLFKINFIDE